MRFEDVAGFRLRRHYLRGAKASDAVAICRGICGAQAQMMTFAYLQIWARNPRIGRAQIEKDLWQSRTLVKTSLMRQTIHLIPTDEFPVYIAALRKSRVNAAFRIMARFGITTREADALTAAILDALSNGPLGRSDIRAAVHPRAGTRVRSWMEKVWSILRIPVAEGLVCYGPGEGNDVKFIRADQWLPKHASIPEITAQCDLLRNYLRAYGPASTRDFSYWSGIPAPDCKRVYAEIAGELMEFGEPGSMILARDRTAFGNSERLHGNVKLLPAFDPFLLGHKKKDHLLEARYYKRVYRNQGWISPVILVDGRVAGVWAHKITRNRLTVNLETFENISRAVRGGIEAEAAGLAAYFAKELEIRW